MEGIKSEPGRRKGLLVVVVVVEVVVVKVVG